MKKVETEKNIQPAPQALAEAADKEPKPTDSTKAKLAKKKPIAGIIALIIGIIMLAAGAVTLVLRLNSKPGLRDAEYLVEIGTWTREGAPSVIWQFTGVGTGTLTTNSHINDYDFIWSIEGDQLKLETDWLYTLNDEYTYAIDQAANILTLNSNGEEWTFVPLAIPAEAEAAEN